MKKTVTINLGGIVFHIDEDAYQLLNNYIENIRVYFKKHPDNEEIVTDIESRFSELLSQNITHQNQAVVIGMVEDVITRIGQPEDFDTLQDQEVDDQEGNSEEKTQSKKSEDFSFSCYFERRKLYRNPDDKIIGGVASGLAAYFKLDTTIVRLILVALMFVTAGTTCLAYIVMWIIVPQANTAIEKLNMYGEDITMENIGKKVSDEASDLKKNYNYETTQSAGNRIVGRLLQIFGVLLKACFILLIIVLAPVWLIIILVLFAIILGLTVGGGALFMSLGEPFVQLSQGISIWGVSAGLITFIIPLGILLYYLLKNIMNLKPVSKTVKWIVLVLWLVALAIFIISSVNNPVALYGPVTLY